jgi:hypothetical protein
MYSHLEERPHGKMPLSQTRVQIPLPAAARSIMHTPERPPISPNPITASLFCFDFAEGEEPVPLPAGAVGVNTAPGLLKHELAEFEAEAVDGAEGLTVAFPAKLQLPEVRFCPS